MGTMCIQSAVYTQFSLYTVQLFISYIEVQLVDVSRDRSKIVTVTAYLETGVWAVLDTLFVHQDTKFTTEDGRPRPRVP